MGDKVTIVGQDGKAKYELDEDNNLKDLREHCQCTDVCRPEQRDGVRRICLTCYLPILD